MTKLLFAAVMLLCGLSFSAWFVWVNADPDALTAPSDQELIENFHRNRAVYERLRQMISEDSSHGVYFYGSEPTSHLAAARSQEYSRLLAEIRPGLEFWASDESMRFIFASNGLLAIGPEAFKGIEYLPDSADRKGKLMSNLDGYSMLPTGEVYLREMEPHWYVIFQKID